MDRTRRREQVIMIERQRSFDKLSLLLLFVCVMIDLSVLLIVFSSDFVVFVSLSLDFTSTPFPDIVTQSYFTAILCSY